MKPGYKRTEVGVIPEEWEVNQIQNVCRLVNGRGFKPHEWQTTGLPIIRIQNLNGSEDFNYYSGSHDPKILVEDGQLLFAWSGSRGTSFGPHVWNGGRALLNYHTWKVVVNGSKVCPDFFFHGLRQLTSYIEDRAHGASALVHTQKWEMEKFPIPIPPLPEQRAIASALSDVDALLAALDRLLAKKRDLKQAAMQQLLTGQTRLPGFEGEWEVKSFGEVFDYFPTATNSRADQEEDGDAIYIHYGDIHTRFHGHLDFNKETPPRIHRKRCGNAAPLRNGDWVMADASEDFDGVGKSIEILGLDDEVIALAGLHTFLLREKRPMFAPGFKGHLGGLKSLHEEFLRVATGMKVFGVSKAALRALLLPIPSLPEQTAIAAVLSDMDAELGALEQRRDKTRALKQGMMQELLTGRTRLI